MDDNNNNGNRDQESGQGSGRRLKFLYRPFVHLERTLGAGILVILPIGITALVLKFFFDLLDPILQPLLQFLPGPQIPGLGIITLIISVYLVGLITTHVVGRRMINVGHRLMERIPVVRSIYSTTRTGVGILTEPPAACTSSRLYPEPSRTWRISASSLCG